MTQSNRRTGQPSHPPGGTGSSRTSSTAARAAAGAASSTTSTSVSISAPRQLNRRERNQSRSSSYVPIHPGTDPYVLLSLAVELDKQRDDSESILRVPLESARLYNVDQFYSALTFLRDYANRDRNTSATTKAPFALTPIVLAGLLADIQRGQQADTTSTRTITDAASAAAAAAGLPRDLGSELVVACQAMRHQALARERRSQDQLKLRRHCQSILVNLLVGLMALSCLIFFERFEWRTDYILQRLHYDESCAKMEGTQQEVCREAEAALWDAFAKSWEPTLGSWTLADEMDDLLLPVPQSEKEAPLAFHTILRQSLITEEELVRWSPTSQHHPRNDNLVTAAPVTADPDYPLRLLGETTVTRLVREAIMAHFSNTPSYNLSVLDVGCGVSGLLYALLPSSNASGSSDLRYNLTYHGISISAAEIFYAQHFAQRYGLTDAAVATTTAKSTTVTFEEQSADGNLSPHAYDAVVTIESLATGRDRHSVEGTLENLMNSLKPGGLFIFVDDVSIVASGYPGYSAPLEDLGLATKLTHTFWMKSFEKENCTVHQVRDLSLEFELEGLTTARFTRSVKTWGEGGLLKTLQKLMFKSFWFLGATRGKMQMMDRYQSVFCARQQMRRNDYDKVSKAYHMYVCIKRP